MFISQACVGCGFLVLHILMFLCVCLVFLFGPIKTVRAAEKEKMPVRLVSCLAGRDDTVTVAWEMEDHFVSDDGKLYLFSLPGYKDGIQPADMPVASCAFSCGQALSCPLLYGTSESRLYNKFVLTVRRGGVYVPVSGASYITNPEAVAVMSVPVREHRTKKGLLVDPFKVDELTELGVEYATYNVLLGHILSKEGSDAIPYSYMGVTYWFDRAALSQYDKIFRELSELGIDIAAILLNDIQVEGHPEFTHPLARGSARAPYRMLNADEEEGVRALAAVSSFLALRYSDGAHGRVAMWIIGNEINSPVEWNHMETSDIDLYTAAYADAFRVCYTAIKSINAKAMVYLCLDMNWDGNVSRGKDFAARDVLGRFAEKVRAEGDLDYGLAEHPYSYPMKKAQFWESSSVVDHSFDTQILTMENIEVLTQYMGQDRLRSPSGGVRSIILSEMGYASGSGEDVQAAAFVYAYEKIMRNDRIDAFMFSRQTDAPDEVALYALDLGLSTVEGRRKRLFDAYAAMGTRQEDEFIAAAAEIVGRDISGTADVACLRERAPDETSHVVKDADLSASSDGTDSPADGKSE